MRRKINAAIFLTLSLTILMAVTAFAGTWKMDAKGWWWDNGNGTYPAGCWQWCDSDGNGSAECYYFDKDGYCLMNITTPDGYTVNKDGAWTEDGVVQTKEVGKTSASASAAATSGNTGSTVAASAEAVLAGKMNGTYHVTSTIPWESRWETLIIENPINWYEVNAKDGMISNYTYAINLTSAKDGHSTRLLSKDGISYQNVGGQSFRDLWHLKDDPTLTFIDSNTFTFDIPDNSVGWIGAGYIYPTVTFTWTKVQ